MSNNLVSQQLPVSEMQIGQLEPIANRMDSSFPEAQRGSLGSKTNDIPLNYNLITTKPMALMEPVLGAPVSQSILASQMQMRQVDVKAANLGPQLQVANNRFGGVGGMLGNAGSTQLSLPVKRKSSIEPMPYSHASQQSSAPNKRVTQAEHRPWLQNLPGVNKRILQVQPLSHVSPLSPATNKKVGLQRSSTPKNQTIVNSSSKGQNESSESVRSKMRESLIAALAVVSQQEEKSSDAGKSPHNEAERSLCQREENSQPGGSACTISGAVGCPSEGSRETLFTKEDSSDHQGKEDENALYKIEADTKCTQTMRPCLPGFSSMAVLPYEDISFSDSFFIKDELLQGNGLSWVMESNMEVAEMEIHSAEKQKSELKIVDGDRALKPFESPESLAFKIEAELFKLYGGVNKKYKEKGRSLLFNLKDRSNPELRERVMSGDILPERLCSMSAEELASKELSQWRMAKAEELAQMVVLPDSDVDIRRLVRKTHKGEFQVEVEHDDTVTVEVSAGISSSTLNGPNGNETEGNSTLKDEEITTGEKDGPENKYRSYTLTIPSNDGSDFLQGLIMDDPLKDEESLPPIVSLDEFMESLNSEPPFDILSGDAGNLMTPSSGKDDSEPKSSGPTPEGPADITEKDIDIIEDSISLDTDKTSIASHGDLISGDSRAIAHSNENNFGLKSSDPHSEENSSGLKSSENEDDVKFCDGKGDLKSIDTHMQSKTTLLTGASRVEHVWEGLVQLTVSSTTSVFGTFMSGERASVKEWPAFLEIKGRVRLEAFEKFLQELPLSRSRAVMVLHFRLKEECTENERASLLEAADSYVLDERVGFAEPSSGVELYFCPPHRKTIEMLGKIIPKEYVETLYAIDNGLIGVVVWRRCHLTSTLSPNTTSHHKHSKKRHFTSRRHQDMNVNVNNFSPKHALPQGFPVSSPRLKTMDDDDDDDVPPGFGPGTTREEDDLPEFNFSGRISSFLGPERPQFQLASQKPSRPVEQMRELVYKYGQTKQNAPSENWQHKGGMSAAIQPWNDEDDDIPEWQPQAPQNQLPVSKPVYNHEQSMLRPQPHRLISQSHMGGSSRLVSHQSVMPMQSANVAQDIGPSWQQGAWHDLPMQGSSGQPNNIGVQANGSQFYGSMGQGMTWQQNAPQSRGFR